MPARADEVETRASWVTLGLLALTYAIQHLDRQVLAILQEPIKHEFLLSDAQIGFLVGVCYAIPFAIAGIPLGIMVDRVVRRNLLAIAAITWSVMTALTGFARSFPQLVLVRCALGAAEAPQVPTSLSLISDLFPARKRGMAIGIYSSGAALGTLAGFAFGAWIAQVHGWRVAFLIAALPGVLVGFALLLFTREPARRYADGRIANSGDGAPAFGSVRRFMISQRSLVWIFVGMAMLLMTATGIMTWASSFLIRIHRLSLSQVGLTIGIAFAVGQSAGSILGGLGGDALGKRSAKLIPVGSMSWALLAVVSASMFAMTNSLYVAVIALTLQFAAASAQFGPAVGLIQSLVGYRMRGTAGATAIVIWNLAGFGLGPQIIGILSDAYALHVGEAAIRYAILTMSFVYVAAIVCFWLSRRTLLSDLERAATA